MPRLRLAASAVLLLAAACTPVPGAVPPSPAGPDIASAPPSADSTGFQTGDSDRPASVSPVASAPAPQQVSDPGHVTGHLTGPCYPRGAPPAQLPDPRCTPGAYDPHVTAAVLCARDAHGDYTYRTGPYRPPSSETNRFKFKVAYPAYGLDPSVKTELDHLISLQLGGANSASNLWPEAPPSPNAKDALETRLRTWTCSASGEQAERRLRGAQFAIAENWVTALDVLGVR